MLKLRQIRQKQEEQRSDAVSASAGRMDVEGASGEAPKTAAVAPAQSRNARASQLRIQKDFAELGDVPSAVVNVPDPNDLMEFDVTITPQSGLYSGAAYVFHVSVPTGYPHQPPKVLCRTTIYHPNIDLDGHVCLNILHLPPRGEWKPVLSISSVIFGLLTLFLEPNPDDPLNKEAAELFIRNFDEFSRTVARTLRGGSFFGRQFAKLK
jgi:ubiquitin-conjugating enzyme E2 M